MNKNTPQQKAPSVLIFDSGVGGLSVYKEIKQLLPNLHYIYAFDNAGFPYGEKQESFIIERVVKIIEQIEKKHPLDLAVIACNSASTVVLPSLREKFTFPIVGVVPAIKPAVALSKNNVVGLLATKATVAANYTHELIKQFADNCKVELLGSSRLVELAEEKLHDKSIDLAEIELIFAPWQQLKVMPDTVILGCTHFPLLVDELKAVLPKHVQFIDSGSAIARRVAALIPGENKNTVKDKANFAICTRLDEEAQMLLTVLQNYQLDSLTEYAI